MKFAYRVGLVLVVNLAIVFGGGLPGVGGAIETVVAPAQPSEQLQRSIDEGFRLLREGSKTSLSEAIPQFEQALKLSWTEGQREGQALALLGLGRIYDVLGEKTKALDFLNQALPIFHNIGDWKSEVSMLNNIGIIYSYLGNQKKAIEFFNRALPISRNIKDQSGESRALNGLGLTHLKLGQPLTALEFLNKSLPISRAAEDSSGEATTLGNLGMVYASLGKPQSALEKFSEALPIWRTVRDPSGEANTLMNIGTVYISLGETPKALVFFDQALLISRDAGIKSIEASILMNIGAAHETLGELQKALDFDIQALSILRDVKDSSGQGTTLNNIGNIYHSLGNHQMALKFYNHSLSASRAIDNKFGEGTTLNNMGLLYADLSEKQKALDFYSQALVIFRTVNNPSQEANVLNNIASIYADLGEKREALKLYNQILPILRDAKNQRMLAMTLNNIGTVYGELGEQQKELEFLSQALAIVQAIRDSVGEAANLNNTGFVYYTLGEHRKALEFFSRSLLISRRGGVQAQEANTLNNIGLVYNALGEKSKALEYYNQALPILRAVGNRSVEASTLSNLAHLYRTEDKLTDALQNISMVIQIVESLRSEFKNDSLKTAYFASVQSYYQFKADILMQLHRQQPTKGYDAQALETTDQSRARGLRELLIQANANINKDISPALLNQEQALNQTLDAKETQLTQLSSQPSQAAQLPALNQEIATLYAQRDDLKNTIRTTNPAYANLQYPKPITLAQIQQQLDSDTLMLQYSLGEKESYLWVIGQSTLHTYILPKRTDIEKTANTLRKELTAQLTAPKSAIDLTQQILAPAAAQLSTKRLVIIPDGILHTIPFAALNTPNTKTYNPLLTNHEITNLPSASTIAILRTTVTTKPRGTKTLAILADPIFNKSDPRLNAKTTQANNNLDLGEQIARGRVNRDLNLNRLPFTETEAKGILSLIPNPNDRTAAFGFDASYDWITDPKISQYRYVHLATHGFFDNDKPALSSIILSSFDAQGRDRKAYLRFPDLFNLNLPTELVVLSACQTGLGNNIPGEGLVGMTRGLMYAGALRVAVSLWNVDDQATSDLMQDFYQNLWQAKQSHAASLRQAQLKLWKQGKAPYYWAAFTLQGEWRN